MHHLHISLIFLLAVLIGCNAGPIIKSPVSLFPEDEPDRSLPVPNQDGANSTMVKISYKCETSSGSPTYDDVKGAVIKLTQKPKDKLCEQLNPGGSFCKKLVTHKGAAISICGPVGVGVLCYQAAKASAAVLFSCPKKYGNTWKVGGMLKFYDWDANGDNFNVVFHRS